MFDNNPRSVRRVLLLTLLLVALVRLVGMAALETWKFPSQRFFGHEEGEIAYALANGDGFAWPALGRAVGPPGQAVVREESVPTSWKAPLSPLIIAGAFIAFGSYSDEAAIAIELFQIALSVLTAYFMFRIGQRLFNEWAGLLSGLIFAFYPASVHFAIQKVEYGTLLTLLGVIILDQTLELSERPGLGRSLLIGGLAGLGLLTNPVILAFYPFGMLWFVAMGRSSWRKRLVHSLAILLCCAAVITPWIARNYRVFGHFVFIRSNFVRELVVSTYGGPRALAAEHGDVLEDKDPAAFAGSEDDVNSVYGDIAAKLVVEHPFRFASRTADRFVDFWTNIGDFGGAVALVVGMAYYSMLLLGLAGIWMLRGSGEARLLLIYVVTMPLPFYVTWSSLGRFRFPIEPVLIVFAAIATISVLSRWFPTLSPRPDATNEI